MGALVWDEVRRLTSLAWPVVVGQLGLVAMGVVDLLMVAPLGKEATAAVGIGNSLSYASLVLAQGAAAGLDPLITQAYGARNPGKAGTEAVRGTLIILVLCVPVIAVHYWSADLMTLLRQPPSVVPLAALYCGTLAHSVLPFAGFCLLRQLLQGGGVMRPAMWVIAIGNVVNLGGDWLLVRVFDQGVAGVAWCTVIVRWVMVVALFWLSIDVLRQAWPNGPILDRRGLWRVTKNALPVSLQIGLEVWAFNCASFVAGALGATAVAAHTSALSAAAVAFMIPLGIAAAASTRVGNLVGAGQDWRPTAGVAVGLGVSVMTVSAALFMAMPAAIGRAYSHDAAVVALVVAVMPLAAGFQWFDGAQVVSFGVLRGLGDTRTPVLFNVIGYWAIGLPVGALLAFRGGLGLVGIWLGLFLGLLVVTVLLLARLAGWARLGPGAPAFDAE